MVAPLLLLFLCWSNTALSEENFDRAEPIGFEHVHPPLAQNPQGLSYVGRAYLTMKTHEVMF